MLTQALLIALPSTAVFGGLSLMSDRPRGALLAQTGLALMAPLVFLAIVLNGPILGMSPFAIAAFAFGVMAACVAGMLYHLYLGRFTEAWAARGVFSLVYLMMTALFGFVFLALL